MHPLVRRICRASVNLIMRAGDEERGVQPARHLSELFAPKPASPLAGGSPSTADWRVSYSGRTRSPARQARHRGIGRWGGATITFDADRPGFGLGHGPSDPG